MDFLSQYNVLIYVICMFLLLVVVFPFIMLEVKKKKNAKLLVNRIIPVGDLSEEDLKKIESFHSSGKKLHPAINRSVCVGCGACVINCKEKGALYLINGKSTLVNPFACKGWGDCSNACPTGANRLIEYGRNMRISVPGVDQNYESNIKGIYIIGSLTGAGLIKEAINQGRTVVNHIMKEVYPDRLPTVMIVGAGPAGLSAMLSCQKFGLPALCVEKENTANTIKSFPKKKVLMAEPVNIPLYGPLWIGDTTKEKLLEAWDRILEKTGVKINTGLRFEHVMKSEGRFHVRISERDYVCDRIVLAVGTRGEPRKLHVPGEDQPHVFYNLLDAEEFSGSDVVIVGAGDSAIEAALALATQKCRVSIVVRGSGFPKAKTRNQERIWKAVKEGDAKLYANSNVKEIKARSVILSGPADRFEIPCSSLFVMIGGELPFRMLNKIGIDLVDREI